MIDGLLRKAATGERFVSGAREEYARSSDTFAAGLQAQDAVILNILRARQATLDTGYHLIHRECLGAPQSNDDHAHAPAWARIPAAPAAGRKASKAQVPTLPRRSHQTVHAGYATCMDGQRYRWRKNQNSRDYRPDDGFNSNPMIYKSFLKARKTVHPGLSRTHQYAISQNSI
jgi:hypothetical protein